jgi:hypothetical protein
MRAFRALPRQAGGRSIKRWGAKMATNLHFAVCEIYRQAISERRVQREGFDRPRNRCASGIRACGGSRPAGEQRKCCASTRRFTGLRSGVRSNSLPRSFQSDRQIVRQIQRPPESAAASDRYSIPKRSIRDRFGRQLSGKRPAGLDCCYRHRCTTQSQRAFAQRKTVVMSALQFGVALGMAGGSTVRRD